MDFPNIQNLFSKIDAERRYSPWQNINNKAMLFFWPPESLESFVDDGIDANSLSPLRMEIELVKRQDKVREVLARFGVDMDLALDYDAYKAKFPATEENKPKKTAEQPPKQIFDLSNVAESGPHQLEDILERAAIRAEAGLEVSREDAEYILALIKHKKQQK